MMTIRQELITALICPICADKTVNDEYLCGCCGINWEGDLND